jgi:hypothetical protein
VNGVSHEDPILLVLPAGQPVGGCIARLLDEPEIRHFALPPLWALDAAGVDLPAALPRVRSVERANLEVVVETLIRLCDAHTLDRLVERTWREVDERVRQHHLDMSIGQTFATIFRMAPPTTGREPPPAFREDRIHESGWEVQYRLAATAESDVHAPEHEGSLIFYPFDPANAAARREADLGDGGGAVLEAFAYESARATHRAFLEGVAARHGWQAVEPRDQPSA